MLHLSRNTRGALVAVIVVLAVLATAPAIADVDVRGGNSCQQRLIRGVYESLMPMSWRTQAVVKINLLNDRDMNAYIRDGSDDHLASTDADNSIDGIFENGPPTITLRSSISSVAMPFTFTHEYGHFFWQSKLTPQDRARYSAIYDHQRRARRLVTDYAATELDEGFAEAFSFYLVSRPILEERDAMSCRFLDEILARTSKNQADRS